MNGLNEIPKRFILSPPVYLKVSIESEDIASFPIGCQLNQTGIGEAHRDVPVAAKQGPDRPRRITEAESDFKGSIGHILQDAVTCAFDIFQQITALRDYSFTSEKRTVCRLETGNATFVPMVPAVQ